MNLLRFSSHTTERDLRLAIVECGRICYERSLMTANEGNISTRLGDRHVLITPAGACKGRLDEGDLVIVDLDGNLTWTHPRRKFQPSSELPLHLAIYRKRFDVLAVIHTHPTFATSLSVAGIPFPTEILPSVKRTLGEVSSTSYFIPTADEEAETIRDLIAQNGAVLLRQHGALTFGNDLDTALTRLERLEHVAEVFWRTQMLGQNTLPTDNIE